MPGGENGCKVYVGDLPRDASEYELEREFEKFGKLKNVWVARKPPGFAFVEFEDPRDADDAVHELDGKFVCGGRLRVEHSHGRSREKSSRGGRGGRPGRYDDDRDKCYKCGRPGHFASECRSRRSSRSRSRSRGRRSRSRSYERRSRSRSSDRRRSRDRY